MAIRDRSTTGKCRFPPLRRPCFIYPFLSTISTWPDRGQRERRVGNFPLFPSYPKARISRDYNSILPRQARPPGSHKTKCASLGHFAADAELNPVRHLVMRSSCLRIGQGLTSNVVGVTLRHDGVRILDECDVLTTDIGQRKQELDMSYSVLVLGSPFRGDQLEHNANKHGETSFPTSLRPLRAGRDGTDDHDGFPGSRLVSRSRVSWSYSLIGFRLPASAVRVPDR